MRFTYSQRKIPKLFANSGDPDQTQHYAASDLGLHCLPITLLRVSRLQWIKGGTMLIAGVACKRRCLVESGVAYKTGYLVI